MKYYHMEVYTFVIFSLYNKEKSKKLFLCYQNMVSSKRTNQTVLLNDDDDTIYFRNSL